ncbi:replication factor A1 [Nematocida displodere]|uniref:Replication factor A1 n=1 Tax=Nematocida displodere TaxID=1805483 RepID=A0A177EIR7_9MICR|nr:replication factor A1 [Nematocida displodere]
MSIQRVRDLEVTKGALEGVMSYVASFNTVPLVVRVVDITLPENLSTCTRITVTVTDERTTQECAISSKAIEEFKTKEIRANTLIQIGERNPASIGSEQRRVLYIKDITAYSNSTGWTSAVASPSKRKGEESQRKEAKREVNSVAELSPFLGGPWCLNIKVVRKAPMREYQKDGSAGKCFKATLADGTGEILMTFFNESADAFYTRLELNKAYEVSGGQIKMANKQFNKTEHSYELSADKTTTIHPIECPEYPELSKNLTFSLLESVKDKESSIVNLLVVAVTVEEAGTIRRRSDNSELTRRNICVTDKSKAVLPLTLWEENAKAAYEVGDVIMLEGVKITRYNDNPQLTVIGTTTVAVNPETSESFTLSGWFKQNKKAIDAPAPYERKAQVGRNTISEIKGKALPMSSVICTITNLKENIYYMACDASCKKKVEKNTDGVYFCNKCNKEVEEPLCRYRINAQIADATGQLWVSIFNEGEALMGLSANELQGMQAEDYDEIYLPKIVECNLSDVVLRVRGKADTYNRAEPQTVYTVDALQRVDYAREAAALLTQIRAMG